MTNLFKTKEKKPIKKEYILLYIAVFLLLIMIIALVYFIFFAKSTEVIVPDLPNYKSVDVGVVDFNDNGATNTDLNNKKNSNLEVKNSIVSDYYKNGILLSNTQVEYLNGEFIVTSGPFSDISMISSISKDGKLKWLTKLDDNEYGNVKVSKTIFYNNNYYVGAISEKNNKKSLIMLKLDESGKRTATEIITEDFNDKIKDIKVSNDTINLITGDSDIILYFLGTDLKETKKEVIISRYVKDVDYVNYQSSYVNDSMISVVVNNNSKYYVVDVDTNTLQVQAKELTDINNLNSEDTLYVKNYLNGLIVYSSNSLYKLNKEHKLINKFDYRDITLEDDTAFKEKYKDDEYISVEDLVNDISIERVKVNQDVIFVNSKTLYSSIYDIYDANLKITKRFILDAIKYSYDDGVILNSFYIDGAIYEVYSYGSETPSIMISKIG